MVPEHARSDPITATICSTSRRGSESSWHLAVLTVKMVQLPNLEGTSTHISGHTRDEGGQEAELLELPSCRRFYCPVITQQGRHTGKTARKQSLSPLIARTPCLEVPCLAQNGHSTKTKHACPVVPPYFHVPLQVSLRPAPLCST